MARTFTSFVVLVALISAVAAAADWPQFQGPDRNGVSTETGLAGAWPEGGPKLLWKFGRLGNKGYGAPVVQGGKIYLLDRVNNEQDVLRCIDLATGQQEWTFSYDCPGKYAGGYDGSRNIPAVDDTCVFTLGPFGHLHCVSKETHQPLWSTNIVKEYESWVSNWGLCQSPVLYKKTVIVAPLSKKAGLVAFDKATGKVVWQTEPLEKSGGMTWTSPQIATIDGVDQVVMLYNREFPRLSGLDAATGKVLWTYRGWPCANPIASPLYLGEGRFFVTGGYKAGCVLVKVRKAGDEWTVDEVFKNKNCGSQAQSPVFYKGYIYASSNDTKAGVVCLDLKGDLKWSTGGGHEEELGSIIAADGKLYNLLSERGVLRLIEAGGDAYKLLAEAKVTGGGNVWAPMALSDGKLLIRSRDTLLCLDVKGDAAAVK